MTAHVFMLDPLSYFPLVHAVLADININQSLKDIADALAAFAGGVAALAFMRAGYLWMFSSDSTQDQARAKAALGAAVVGTVICLGAVTLANLLTSHIK